MLFRSRLANYLATEKIAAIYSSPMKRAVQTAEPLAQTTGLPISIVDEVAEYDRLSNEYIPIEELRAANDERWQKLLGASGSRIQTHLRVFAIELSQALSS